jgi:hypothetical protein
MMAEPSRHFPHNQLVRADIFSAGAFRRLSLVGRMSGLTPAPTKRVHDPSGVATHDVALGSAGQIAFRSESVVMRFAADPIGSLSYAAERPTACTSFLHLTQEAPPVRRGLVAS